MKLLAESLFTGHGYESHRAQKRATTFISRPPAPPEPAPEPWAWFDPWPTWIWWRPELKLAHSRLVESLGERETSGPAPSRDNVAKQTEQKMAEGELEESVQKTKHPNSVCVCLHSGVRVTCCVLIPDFDGAVMGGCCYLSGATRRHWEKHAAGCGLKVASVLHYFTAWLAQVPELITQTQLHWEQKAMSEVSKQSAQDTGYVRTHQRFQGSVEDKVSLHEGQHCVVARRGVFLK